MRDILLLFTTNGITALVCWYLFKESSKQLLLEQEKRLRKEFSEQIGDFRYLLSHNGPQPLIKSLKGLTRVTSWGIERCIDEYRKHIANKEYNTTANTQDLQFIRDEELRRMELIAEALDKGFFEFIEGLQKFEDELNSK